MDPQALDQGIRKFLRTVGVTSQRDIEQAVARAVADGTIAGTGALSVTMTLRIDALQLERRLEGSLPLE